MLKYAILFSQEQSGYLVKYAWFSYTLWKPCIRKSRCKTFRSHHKLRLDLQLPFTFVHYDVKI